VLAAARVVTMLAIACTKVVPMTGATGMKATVPPPGVMVPPATLCSRIEPLANREASICTA
jgi:hypothetical protein